MRKGMIRILAALLALLMLPVFSCALGEGGEWVCDSCGQVNTGNFCGNCGSARPVAGWTCTACGQPGNTGNFCTNCGAGRPGTEPATVPAGPVDEGLEQIPGETDRVKLRVNWVEASSFITNSQYPNRWEPFNAADGDESTCWQFSAKKGLKGKSWIRLDLASPRTVDEIWFKNGFWAFNDQGMDQYSINARLKEIRVEFLYAGESKFRDQTEIKLADEAFTDWQRFSLGAHSNVTSVRVAVMSTYQGSHYKNDVCLSEVMLVEHAPAATALAPFGVAQTTIYESRPDVTGAPLKERISARSGPGTQYDEPGTFFSNNWNQVRVKVLGKSWDGSIWWVLTDFDSGSQGRFRVWTGLKRVDVNIDKLKEIYPIGQGTVDATSETYRGPGGNYAKAKVNIPSWVDVEAFGRENGYVEVEFEMGGRWYRLWVPESKTSIDWGTDFSGN